MRSWFVGGAWPEKNAKGRAAKHYAEASVGAHTDAETGQVDAKWIKRAKPR